MEDIFLCLDVGGTEIKAGAVGSNGALFNPIRYFPARANEDAQTLLAHLTSILMEIRVLHSTIAGVRLAFPGPFDYQEGICLLQGLAKYDHLYGVNLRQELSLRMNIAPEKIRFANDASAFALGEMGFGQAKNAARALFVCIGTGCGSAFGMNGILAPGGTSGVPMSGCLYDVPFLDSCIDDYLSRRGLMALTMERLGEELDGKALAQRVQQGDEQARLCFFTFGQRIRDALLPFLKEFEPEVLCFGGQITRSAALFLQPIADVCRERGIRLYITEDTSVRTLQGLTRI